MVTASDCCQSIMRIICCCWQAKKENIDCGMSQVSPGKVVGSRTYRSRGRGRQGSTGQHRRRASKPSRLARSVVPLPSLVLPAANTSQNFFSEVEFGWVDIHLQVDVIPGVLLLQPRRVGHIELHPENIAMTNDSSESLLESFT